MVEKIKEMWEWFLVRGEELSYQASPERKELATQRLAQLRAYMNQPYGGTITNPYEEL